MHTNSLSKEKSPYLLQHQHNPVNWYAWNDAAFTAARTQNKPIFLSIGYSTCYWCHVMEKDSFENEEVAKILNEHFVAIKVDREERPDVDGIYMNAVVSLTGHGGWPMSVFLTPERKPFYGGTFFRRDQFMLLLGRIAETWESHRTEIDQTANQLTSAIQRAFTSDGESTRNEEIFRTAFEQFSKTFDSEDGGFSPAPKFPPSGAIRLLLRIHRRSGNERALQMAVSTLAHMARGGIYDHLGGGFHRYSTDTHWLVPHFEKMLYDNGQLAVAYLEAYQLTKDTMFSSVAQETLDYVLRDMTGGQGEFYSAEDAGDVGKEGEFYVWKESELKSILSPEEFEAIRGLYGVTEAGNFEEHTNVLHLVRSSNWESKQTALAAGAQKKLFKERSKRRRPHRDDKTLVSWNGLMISALALGSQVLDNKSYLAAAEKAAEFIQKNLWKEKKLLRRFRDGDARFSAYLDDYAFLIHGLLALYEAGGDQKWLRWTMELQDALDAGYWDSESKGYFIAASDESTLIARPKEFSDGAEPAGNGVALQNLLKLFDLTLDQKYAKRAEELFGALPSTLTRYPSAFTSALMALDYRLDRSKEIAVVGPADSEEAKSFSALIGKAFLPNKVVAWGTPAGLDDSGAIGIFRGKQVLDGKTTFYVCEEGTCKLPTHDAAKAISLASEFKKIELK